MLIQVQYHLIHAIIYFTAFVLYLSIVIVALIAFRNNVQGSSSDSSDNFFPNFSIHHIICETHIKAPIWERA